MDVNLIELSGGINAGFQYSTGHATEKEINQGGNYLLSALVAHPQQIASLGSVISRLGEALITDASTQSSVLLHCNLAPFYCIPISLYLAAVKQGMAGDFGKWANSKLRITLFPERLGERTVKVLSFCSEHFGNVTRIAMVAGSVGLIAVGNYAFAVPTLAFMGYQIIDQRGWVPYKISLFMEKYMPIMSAVAGIVGGTGVVRVFSVISLALTGAPQSVSWFLYEKVDWLGRKIVGGDQNLSIQAFNAPWKEKRDLSFQAINDILDTKTSDFEVDPAHCPKWSKEQFALPEDHHYEKFLTIFDKIDWTTKYSLLRINLRDDERFREFLLESFPGIENPTKEFTERFDHYMSELARNQNQTVEQYAAAWARKEMVILVDGLLGKRRVPGLQSDLEDAIDNLSKILPYIEALEQQGRQVDLEDAIKEIAISCGGYCSRGIKRTANEMMPAAILHYTPAAGTVDSGADYETKIKQSLQFRRQRILQRMFRMIVDSINLPDAITRDVHGFDIYRIILSFGFYPMTENEKRKFGFGELFAWELYDTKPYGNIRQLMMHMYVTRYFDSIDSVIEEHGEVEFANHIRQMINTNPKLSEEEKETIIESWGFGRTNEQFHQLFLVMLGVLRKKAPNAAS